MNITEITQDGAGMDATSKKIRVMFSYANGVTVAYNNKDIFYASTD